jgi:hypothetical protein
MKKSRKAYEEYLNELYADTYSWGEIYDNFSHFNNCKIKESTLLNAYHNHTIGTLERKYDPIAFNAGFHEWSKV